MSIGFRVFYNPTSIYMPLSDMVPSSTEDVFYGLQLNVLCAFLEPPKVTRNKMRHLHSDCLITAVTFLAL
jgi:hypothetical protein